MLMYIYIYIKLDIHTLQLYTIEGQPVIKKRKQKVHKPKQILVVRNTWKCIVYDQWVIGVVLENTSIE